MADAHIKPASRRQLVPLTVAKLRELIFNLPSGELIGSLADLARELGVGIVTVQQVARVLEHEGLLDVRRGPGGGYFGRRPDIATLERSLAAYLRSEPASHDEVLEITSLLFNELCAAAARCDDPVQLGGLSQVARSIACCTEVSKIVQLEWELQEQLFRMVRRPLFELLTRVALQHADTQRTNSLTRRGFGFEQWQESRKHIIAAIIARDPKLAHFEANRRNRQRLLASVGEMH
jgi:GntR family transcriptional regulator, transcriptional repressor for pyruvate dehydrogenase complex